MVDKEKQERVVEAAKKLLEALGYDHADIRRARNRHIEKTRFEPNGISIPMEVRLYGMELTFGEFNSVVTWGAGYIKHEELKARP